jgi:hypothetical protein
MALGYPMKQIAILALVICLSAIDASAKSYTNDHGRRAVSHEHANANKKHPAQTMPGALSGAYQR